MFGQEDFCAGIFCMLLKPHAGTIRSIVCIRRVFDGASECELVPQYNGNNTWQLLYVDS